MPKGLSSKVEQEHKERRQYILQRALDVDLKTLAQEFFVKFDLRNKSAAHDALHSSLIATGNMDLANETKTKEFKKWMTDYFSEGKQVNKASLDNVIERNRTKLRIAGVRKGSKVIQSGMDLLVPEGNSTVDSGYVQSSNSASTKRKIIDTNNEQASKEPRILRNSESTAKESLSISLDDFIIASPEDFGPIPFFEIFGPQSSNTKIKWNTCYISLFSQALKSDDANIISIGRKMKSLWQSQSAEVDNYWGSMDCEAGSDHVSSNSSQEGGNMNLTCKLLGSDLPSQSSGSDFVGRQPASARSSLNSIDIRFVNRLVGPGETSSALSGESLLLVGDENVSARLMSARRSNVSRQSQLENFSDILSLNFIFTEEFLDEHLTDNMKADFKSFSVPEYDVEEMTILGKVAMTRDRLPTPNGFEEVYEPDFFGERDGYPFIMMEAKKPDAHPDMLDYDVQKLPQMMKLSLNQMISSGIRSPRVIGLLVHERQCEVMVMNLPYEALYTYQSIGTFEIPEDYKQLGLFLASIGPLKCAKLYQSFGLGDFPED
ncbi:hypothetical protein BGX27_009628 [Mortierella sp. AM989]|nr:hypothetical protein BGX27_009628 [Mortierella sp. AM989]